MQTHYSKRCPATVTYASFTASGVLAAVIATGMKRWVLLMIWMMPKSSTKTIAFIRYMTRMAK